MEPLLNKIALITTSALQLAVLYLLIKRRLQKRFVWFLTYITYELCESAVRLAVSGNHPLYFKIYWLTAAGGVILTVMAVRESFLNVFWVHTRIKWFTRVTWSCVALALVYAVLKAWLFPPVHGGWQTAAIIGSEVAVGYSISAVAIVYFVSRWIFRIKGQEWETGIMWGFAIYESLALVGSITRSIFGSKYRIVSEWLPAAAYIIGEVTWVLELRRDEPEVVPPAENLAVDYFRNMEDYIKVLGRVFRRKT